MLKARRNITSLLPYSSLMADREGLCLDLNENTGGCSPRVVARLKSLTSYDLARYPNRDAGEQLVAEFLGVPSEQVLLTNGVDEALSVLATTYLGEDDEMILAEPTFVMYSVFGQAAGAQLARLQMDQDFAFPTGEVLRRISPRTRLITIANPNNPTGLTVSRAELLRIIEAASNAAVLVDEAYFEFYGETLLPELARYANLIIARTFSKAYGLAGLRLGVLVGAPEQIGCLRRICSPFNVNQVALACLEAALADQAFVGDYIRQIKQGRERLAKLCGELGLRAWPSQTNFVLVRVGTSCAAFVEAMKRRRILVRDMSASPGCEGCVRISVGTSEQMDGVLRAMREEVTKRTEPGQQC